MEEPVTVSVKVSQRVRERMRKLGIRASEVLKRTIEGEVKRKEVESIKDEIKRLKSPLDKIPLEEVVAGIREDRDPR